jgi:hypothetical protein
MNNELSTDFRDYLKSQNEELFYRVNEFWLYVTPILEKQNRPNSNENGYSHVKMVEHNSWRLIKESDNLNSFNAYELFILSCSACSHDFDKGLFFELADKYEHGKNSGEYLKNNYEKLHQRFPEMVFNFAKS